MSVVELKKKFESDAKERLLPSSGQREVSHHVSIDWDSIKNRYGEEKKSNGEKSKGEKSNGEKSKGEKSNTELDVMKEQRKQRVDVLNEIEEMVLVESESISYEYEEDEEDEDDEDDEDEKVDFDMSVLPPDEEAGQYDWTMLEQELLAGADEDDLDDDDGEDSEIRRMQQELEAQEGGLQTTDILATLAALEAPHEQLESDDDEPTKESESGSSYESDSDSSELGVPDADLAALDAAALRALVVRERQRATQAKSTIGSLVEQITEYQSAMEEEKLALERRVKEATAECAALEQLQEQREAELSAFYEKQIEDLIHEVEGEKEHNKSLSNETIANLQTLMVELQNIEEVNAKLNAQLAEEREQHAEAIKELDALRKSAPRTPRGGRGSDDEDGSKSSRRHRSKISRRGGGPITPRTNVPAPPVSSQSVATAIAAQDAVELARLCGVLQEDNDVLREAIKDAAAAQDATQRKIAQIGALVADIQGGSATPASTPKRPTTKAPEVAEPFVAMQTMPAMSAAAREKMFTPTEGDAGTTTQSRASAQADTRPRATASPVQPAWTAAEKPKGEKKADLMLKMRKLINTHEETLTLLAKSSGGTSSTPVGTLRRNKGVAVSSSSSAAAAVALPRLSTRVSMLHKNAEMSAAELEKRVQNQRRRFGLALSLTELPEPVSCMLDVQGHVWVATVKGHLGMWSKETRRLTEVRNTGAPSVQQLVLASSKTVWGISGKDNDIYVWSIKKKEMGKKLSGHTKRVTALLVVGKHVWSTGADMTVRVWNATSFKHVKTIPVQTFMVSMHLHGGKVWMGTESLILRWDPRTHRKVDMLRGHTKMVTALCTPQDQDRVWSASADCSVCVWDGTQGTLMHRFEAHGGRVLDLSAALGAVWSCAADKSIKCWDATTYKPLRSVLGAHDDVVTSLLYVGNDDKNASSLAQGELWSGSLDQTVSVWSCNTRYNIGAPSRRGSEAVMPTAMAERMRTESLRSLLDNESTTERPGQPAPVPDASEDNPPVTSSGSRRRRTKKSDKESRDKESRDKESRDKESRDKDTPSTASSGSSRSRRPKTQMIKKSQAATMSAAGSRMSIRAADPEDGVKLVTDATATAVLDGTADYGDRAVIIAHPVSTSGAGDCGEFAVITKTWNKPQAQFVKWHSKRNKASANFKLGSYQLVQVEPERNIYVANLLVCDSNGVINDAALQQCITNLAIRAQDLNAIIHMAKNDKWHAADRDQTFLSMFFRIPLVRVWLHSAKSESDE